ncbi:M1 family metallopeptidase [Neolewinella lacunae]|uniref:M1 family metallopeptidase n=1 Tax=Neolewinella lacunae TaxID=1517758 RepID=A0A923T9F3_9BACT|nr:M1 family metallopeptidase [Neolewinella lacunae]MBC6996670.1 M1 family metallopeptidase [Neolewinella lacunae]MDN3634765.1 M1 family metallopeptidase [Neolewinella lacunae]
MPTRFFLAVFSLCLSSLSLCSQPDRWQQRAEYAMEIDFDVKKNQYTGEQTLKYFNNSPDTIDRVFYHLYFNAFQPGSMMDVRNLTLPDADSRVGERIKALQEDEIGYIKVSKLSQDGTPLEYATVGTILEVELAKPILPGASTTFRMEWDAQVPLQIRRSGRDNAEGIEYSMAQWYPKMAEYDYQGWHANPYVGREFYSIWGDFDVKITIDSDYVVGGTGYLQNASEVGYGYAPEPRKRDKKLTYHFKAPNVGDFMWAADPDYRHTSLQRADGMTMNFFFQPGEKTTENWENLPKVMDEAFAYINEHYGHYPYEQYSFVQGGDGGMEYPMGTLITGERSFVSLVGVSVHELMHSWYQMMLGTNESLYAWMDEGFTSWASSEVMNHLRGKGLIPGTMVENPHERTYLGLRNFRASGLAEPLSVHADHFATNAAYGVAAYTNGAVFLEQLRYVIGEEAFAKTMLRYFHDWKFKHPNPNDFIRIAEKCSGMELDWYKEYWVNTTHYADYGVKMVEGSGNQTTIVLEKVGRMPMPVEVLVKLKDGSERWFYAAPRILRATKAQPAYASNWTILEDWPWTNPEYTFRTDLALDKIASVTINPTGRMFEDSVENNQWMP